MTTLWFDCETFSECDLKTHSTPRYAAHESTEIIVAQWALNDEPPHVFDCTGRHFPLGFDRLLRDPTVEVVAHNSMFDRSLVRHVWGIDVPIERWRDTMVKGMVHGLPGALDKMGGIMGLSADEAKDKRGKQLIQLFCKPQARTGLRATRETHPVEWAEFLEYSRQDIVAMRALDKKLPTWNFRGRVLDEWHLDQRINDRGFAVDVELAEAAILATEVEQKRLKTEVQEATLGEVENVSKRDQLLKHILEAYGVTLPDVKADTLRRRLEDPELPEGVKLLLSIRLEATKTSTAKYKALIKAVSADGRLRNTLQFAGAQRTMRWAGRTFQPQNLARPSKGFDGTVQEAAVYAIKNNCQHAFFDNVMQTLSDCVRGCIVAPAGKKLDVADLANIEGRMLAWLAGEEWKLGAFTDYDTYLLDANGQRIPVKDDFKRKGPDLYNVAYGRSFNIDPFTVDKEQRQIGKVQELGLGYEGGVAAFITFAAVYKMDLDKLADAVWATASQDALDEATGMWGWAVKKKRTVGLEMRVYVACEVLKRAWRNAHPMVTALWASANDAFKKATRNPGETFNAGPHIKVRRDGAWLRVRLPSGRYVCYLQPEVGDDGCTYLGVNQYTRQWSRIKTYGGKLVENWTQAAARDVLAWNMPDIEASGREIVLTVHDEVLTECPDTDEFQNSDLANIMAKVPEWATGLPLAAAGFQAYRYRKG